ncbi:MAG: hypothetical protein IH845_04065 [Nanoarchaeota archaeon]|nr:hypothetical protein [Nanoarchaeota archaeon]
MDVTVREKNIEEIEDRLLSMDTPLNKITYLESVLKEAGFNFEVKRFLWGRLSDLYCERKMFEKAARAMSNKAALEIMSKDRIESFITAAELYSKIGKVEDADVMFARASRDSDVNSIVRVKLARKNIYFGAARELEGKGKRGSAVKFYEKLMKMALEDVERTMIKEKLIGSYKGLGMFREARLLEGVD